MFERVDKQSLGVEYPPACESERRRAEVAPLDDQSPYKYSEYQQRNSDVEL